MSKEDPLLKWRDEFRPYTYTSPADLTRHDTPMPGFVIKYGARQYPARVIVAARAFSLLSAVTASTGLLSSHTSASASGTTHGRSLLSAPAVSCGPSWPPSLHTDRCARTGSGCGSAPVHGSGTAVCRSYTTHIIYYLLVFQRHAGDTGDILVMLRLVPDDSINLSRIQATQRLEQRRDDLV